VSASLTTSTDKGLSLLDGTIVEYVEASTLNYSVE